LRQDRVGAEYAYFRWMKTASCFPPWRAVCPSPTPLSPSRQRW
jgi:hypothetical protein